ncbi:MAG: rhomboid family intramembrane serine protease [Acidobacteriaceae bacterium]
MEKLKRFPVLTVSILAITVTLSCIERRHPVVLRLLQRDPIALSHQWWRLISPLLVQPDPWPLALCVFSLFFIVGALSEQLWKRSHWTLLYLLCGLTGEIAGYLWQPYSAGMSVAGAGLLGSLAAWVILRTKAWQAKLGAGFVLVGAVILVCISDIHGPPILVGALLGTIIIIIYRPANQREKTRPLTES